MVAFWLLIIGSAVAALALQRSVFSKRPSLARVVAAVGAAFLVNEIFFWFIGFAHPHHPVKGYLVGAIYSVDVVAGYCFWRALGEAVPRKFSYTSEEPGIGGQGGGAITYSEEPFDDEAEYEPLPDPLPPAGTPLAGLAAFMFLVVFASALGFAPPGGW